MAMLESSPNGTSVHPADDVDGVQVQLPPPPVPILIANTPRPATPSSESRQNMGGGGIKRKRGDSAHSPPQSSIINISSDSEGGPEPHTIQSSLPGDYSAWLRRAWDSDNNPPEPSNKEPTPSLALDQSSWDVEVKPGAEAQLHDGPKQCKEQKDVVDLTLVDDDVKLEMEPYDEPKLSKEQRDLVDLIASGRNVFYTGSAGCGKSTVLKAAVELLRALGLVVEVVAPTGRAALQVNGTSTWSYMGWTPDANKKTLEELKQQLPGKHVRKRIRKTDVLVIDEISMVENHHLERMNACMKHIRSFGNRGNVPAFGGVQVILTGDFCQLPPVKPFQHCMICGQKMIHDDDEMELNCPDNHGPFLETDKWAFKSTAWEEANLVHVHLKEIHRQNDEYFIKMLQKCRLGIPFSLGEMTTLKDHPCRVNKATRLLCTRREVSATNSEYFNKLKTQIHPFKCLDDFIWKDKTNPSLKFNSQRSSDGTLAACKDHRLEPEVELRIGMLVILQVNLDLRKQLCNGSQGIVCGFEEFDPAKLPKAKSKNDDLPPNQTINGEHAELRESQIARFIQKQKIKVWPRVLFHNGQKRTIYATCIVNTVGSREPYSLLHRTQIPLTPGWAMSVHKSQGMTLDRVIVNLTNAFEEGQVYVALSRATSLDGLKIEGSSEALSFATGGNEEVRAFLKDKFGDELFPDHCGSESSDSDTEECLIRDEDLIEEEMESWAQASSQSQLTSRP